jgi:hypothetical protein
MCHTEQMRRGEEKERLDPNGTEAVAGAMLLRIQRVAKEGDQSCLVAHAI